MGDHLDLGSVIDGLGPWTCHGLCHDNPAFFLQHCEFPPGYPICLSCCPNRAIGDEVMASLPALPWGCRHYLVKG